MPVPLTSAVNCAIVGSINGSVRSGASLTGWLASAKASAGVNGQQERTEAMYTMKKRGTP